MNGGEKLAEALPETALSRRVDALLKWLGNAISWVWLVLLVVIVANVVLRYLFAQGRIEFEEIQWHLYSLGFMLGLSSAYADDAHVRVDVLRERFSATTRAWIELYGIVLLLVPFIVLVLFAAGPFVAYSWETSEVSEAPGGLGMRWLIKSVLAAGFLLLLAGALSRLSRIAAFLFGGKR